MDYQRIGDRINSNCVDELNQRLSLIADLKDNDHWLENEDKCSLICETVSLLDGSSLNHLYTLTPFILRLTDDHQPENKLKGLHCLTNLMNCYSLGDLQSANFHQLFWSTLKTLLFTDDLTLIQSLIPILLRFIVKFSLDSDEIDQCFNQLIKNHLLNSNQNLKQIYLDGIYQFIQQWPNQLIKFTKDLLRITLIVIEETINQQTYNQIVTSTKILELIISLTDKLCYIYVDQLLLSFIKMKYNLIDPSTKLNDDQINNLNTRMYCCLSKLNTANPMLLTDYCNLIKEKLSDEDDTNFVINFLMNSQNH